MALKKGEPPAPTEGNAGGSIGPQRGGDERGLACGGGGVKCLTPRKGVDVPRQRCR